MTRRPRSLLGVLSAGLAITMACGGSSDPSPTDEPMSPPGSMGSAGAAGRGGAGDTGAAGDAGAAGGDTWTSFAMNFMETYCASCHPDNPLSERDYRSYEVVVGDADRIRCGVSPTELDGCGTGSPVPKQFPIGDGPMPSDEERSRLVAWIDAGMPE